jgi:hypothetical protein
MTQSYRIGAPAFKRLMRAAARAFPSSWKKALAAAGLEARTASSAAPSTRAVRYRVRLLQVHT